MSNPKLEVGQELFFMPNEINNRTNRAGRIVTIEKIGRKWITLSSYGTMRAHKEELWVDGGDYISPGQCYHSENDYLDTVKAYNEYEELRNLIKNNRRDKFTRSQINAAREALGLVA